MDDESNEELQCVYDPLIALMQRFEGVSAVSNKLDTFEGLSVEEALQKHIVDGIKKGLENRLDHALLVYEPLQIINQVLLSGMKTVGELFGSGKMQLPFVLQSAEVMKTAVKFLEPKMDKLEGSERGSILLATVAGDVHDIGKNLVDIILSNNGYRVVNLGIKQPINAILEAAEKNRCQVIGMSGLLVKSTLIMKENLEEINLRGLSHYPVILGGAALTRSYVEYDLRSIYEGRVFYAQDAFEGLRLLEKMDDPAVLQGSNKLGPEPSIKSHRVSRPSLSATPTEIVHSKVEPLDTVPKLPFYGYRNQTKFDIFDVYRFINPIALFRGQWQYRRPPDMSNPDFQTWLEDHVEPIFERIKREIASRFKPKVQWGYFPCYSQYNDLIILSEDQKSEVERFSFPRQNDGRFLCISDYFRSEALFRETGVADTVGFSIVTVGNDITEYERKLFANGDYKEYLFVHGIGVELAEALAEYWHKQIRIELGLGDQDPEEMKLLFAAKYQGSRYSFGYPACPNLEDQAILFRLLNPNEIGIELSEEFMLIPEQSTSAIVVHHPDAKYFNIR